MSMVSTRRLRPRTRAKIIQVALYAVFVAVIVFVALAADWKALQTNFFDISEAKATFPDVVYTAAKNTVVYTAISFAGSLVGGLVLALMKLSTVSVYRWVATAYIELFRGLPALLVIFTFAFAVPIAFNWHPPGGSAGSGLVALIVVYSAYVAETMRAGIQAVPKGQTEAARSLGMRPSWTMVSVVLPQAFRIIIPPLTNELVTLIKDTSLLFIAGMALEQRELTTFARDTVSQSANSTALTVAALMYLVVTLPLTQLVAHLERRNAKAR